MENIEQRFGKRVVALRAARHWTQEDLASRAGISVRSISSIENGVYSITLENIEKLAKAFGLSIAELFDFGY